ncbi:MAG: alpha/beta hydrolase [Pseudomonadota bacterium]|nr:alpha/beta hydrolase [Pseudomonadota bacterium]
MKMVIKVLVGAAVTAFGISACSPFGMINFLANSEDVSVSTAISYGSHEKQRLDIYRPVRMKGSLPTILFFYGGSWKRGSRENYAFVGHALAQRGFVVVISDYRLYPEVKFPIFVHDGAQAIAWVTENIGKYGGLNKNIHLMGHSAGAHIAALLVLDEEYLRKFNLGKDTLGRWVGLSGPYAFYPSKVHSVKDVFEGVAENLTRPVVRVGRGAPDALLIHGSHDTAVSPENSVALAHRMNELGNRAFAVIYEGVGHGLTVGSLTFPFTGMASTLNDAVSFLKTGKYPRVRGKNGGISK